MRLHEPRIAPLTEDDWTPAQRAQLEPLAARSPLGRPGPVLNIFATLARDPEALKAFLAWGGYVLSRKNPLPAREREIVILRIGWLCKAGYEWTQHLEIGRRWGLTDAEMERIKGGAGAEGWTPAESALLAAADDLHHDQFVGEAAWAALRSHFSEAQCMGLVFTVGQYTQVSMILNTFGVQLDEGQTLDPQLAAFTDGSAAAT